MVRGPTGTRALLHANGLANGQTILTWQTANGKTDTVEFKTYPRRFFVHTEPLIFQTWELLMSKVKIILTEPENPIPNVLEAMARERAQSEARGIAEVLAILMKPFLSEPDEVVRAAVKSFREPDYQVPGLGVHLWDPTRNPDGSLRTPTAEPKIKTTPAMKPKPVPKVDNKSTRTLSPEEAAGIKEAVSSGMFSKEDVAAMFKVSMATVEKAVAT